MVSAMMSVAQAIVARPRLPSRIGIDIKISLLRKIRFGIVEGHIDEGRWTKRINASNEEALQVQRPNTRKREMNRDGGTNERDCQLSRRGGDERLFNQHIKSHACLFTTSGTPYYFCLSQTCGFGCESMDT